MYTYICVTAICLIVIGEYYCKRWQREEKNLCMIHVRNLFSHSFKLKSLVNYIIKLCVYKYIIIYIYVWFHTEPEKYIL